MKRIGKLMPRKEMLEMNATELKPRSPKYPDIRFWEKRKRKLDRIKIINPGDFPVDAIIESLGLSKSSLRPTFGITNEDEIRSRTEMMRFLIENEEVSKWVQEAEIPFLLPRGQQEFLNYFDPTCPHNPYWEKVTEFLEMLEDKNMPTQVTTLVSTLRQSLGLERYETRMARMMEDKIENVAVMAGVMTFRLGLLEETVELPPAQGKKKGKKVKRITGLDLGLRSSEVYGQQLYSYELNNDRLKIAAAWTKKWANPFNWVGLGLMAKAKVMRQNKKEIARCKRGMAIDVVSTGMETDVTKAVLNRLHQLKWRPLQKYFDGATVHVHYTYNENGLKVFIFSIEPNVEAPEITFEMVEFDEQEESIKLKMKAAQKRCKVILNNQFRLDYLAGLKSKISRQIPGFFSEAFGAASPNMDSEHKWFVIDELFNAKHIKPVVKAAKKNRAFFQKAVSDLAEVARLAEILRKKSRELKEPICFPEVLGNGYHEVAFERIIPLHLLAKLIKEGKKAIAITNLIPVNGRLVILTGLHGKGKTVATLSIPDNLWLAQSVGIVFGKGFRYNVKEVIGCVQIERGQRSVSQVLLRKYKAIFKAVKKYKGNKIFLAFDEVGIGTQEASGHDFGMDVLRKVQAERMSAVLNTQILSLAEQARDELNAACFKVTARRGFEEGIAPGGLETLSKKMGVAKLLRVSN